MDIKKFEHNEIKRYEIEFAGRPLSLEIGKLANQTDGSCTVSYGETVVLATAVIAKEPREGIDFFPLMVDYEERLYAAGKIKGSRWIKREGRPSDDSVLTARLVDRTIRPLFDESIQNDVQVILTVLSYDGENDPDFVSLLAASAALSISRIPWKGPIGGIRIGRVVSTTDPNKKEWAINPTVSVKTKSDLDLFVAGKNNKVIMIETSATEISEVDILEGIKFSLKHITKLVSFIDEITKEAGRKKLDILELNKKNLESTENDASGKELRSLAEDWLKEKAATMLYNQTLSKKDLRKEILLAVHDQLDVYLEGKNIGKDRRKKAQELCTSYMERLISEKILSEDKRIDGRKIDEVRKLSIEAGVLPRTHGSALFTRGETQVLSVVTLGSPGDEQSLEGIDESGTKRFMHHYNFPPFSVGETGPMRSPGRREIGHGALAEKALHPVLPSRDDFPYTIRVVSEVLSSNGSSSMASVCGSSLALMDAGVPIKKAVAGIAMGLASDSKGNYKVITDLQDLEDGQGGMDFKIAGTLDGITTIQLDTKTEGLSLEVLEQTLNQAKAARMVILDAMNKVIAVHRTELSPYAPRILMIKISPDKIREVIGPGGKVINEIIGNTGVQIDIEEDGTVFITSPNQTGAQKAVEWIHNLTKEIKVGEIFKGKVSRILEFGAFVELTPNQTGMIHISELAPYRVRRVNDVVKIGDVVSVKVIAVDDQGRINLSLKQALNDGLLEISNRNNRPHNPPKRATK